MTHPRTPVLWEPEPACMTIVDRSVSPIVEFKYTIPYEDLVPMGATDEVDNSRTHQFLAFCRPHSVQLPLPNWLSQADVDIADAKDLVDTTDLKPTDIVETDPEWQDCMVRITGDEERRKIVFSQAAMPVTWDTTGLPVGPYVVSGYTWEPAFNIYSLRGGVVKVVDDPDLAASPPALAITNVDDSVIVYETELLHLVGCFSALDGSTITGYWAHTDNDGGPLTWHSFGEDTPVSGDEFDLPFMPPAETVTKLIAMRVDITDPMDRTYTAHLDALASILPGSPPAESGGCDGSGFIADPNCGDDSGSADEAGESASEGGASAPNVTGGTNSTGGEGGPTEGSSNSSGGAGTGETGTQQTPPASEGCAGCSVGGPGSALAWLFGPLWLRRRRRG